MTTLTTDRDLEFSRVLASREVSVTFQPIIDLASGEIVALEALARGPAKSALESPAELFAAAHRRGRTAELDWVCRAAAFRAVLDGEIPPSISLFVNTEPDSLSTACPADLLSVVTQAEARLRVFVEVNDRDLTADPAGLLAAVDRARAMSWGIAVDDVGSSRAPVAMLPVLRADAVKLDLGLLRKAAPDSSSAIVLAALRYVEETGAALCVERIENKDDLHWARAIGAVYGQGYHIAPPGPLADHYQPPRSAVRLVADSPGDAPVSSPFDLLSGLPTRRVEIPQFKEVARTVAFGAVSPGASPIILIGIGDTPYDPAAPSRFPAPEHPLITVLLRRRGSERPLGGGSRDRALRGGSARKRTVPHRAERQGRPRPRRAEAPRRRPSDRGDPGRRGRARDRETPDPTDPRARQRQDGAPVADRDGCLRGRLR